MDIDTYGTVTLEAKELRAIIRGELGLGRVIEFVSSHDFVEEWVEMALAETSS